MAMNDLKEQLVSCIITDVRFAVVNAFLAGFFLSTLRIPNRRKSVKIAHTVLGIAELIMMCVMMMFISMFLKQLSH